MPRIKIKQVATIYSKFCISCIYPEEYLDVVRYLDYMKIPYKFKRTTYMPKWHKDATLIYGSEDYDYFIIYRGKVTGFMKFAEECKDKLAKIGKCKEIRNDVQGLPEATHHDGKDTLGD